MKHWPVLGLNDACYLSIPEKPLNREANIFRDLPQKDWRNVPSSVKRKRRTASVCVSVLFMRATLTCFNEAKILKNRSDLSRFENRRFGHY
jgi:hypothetical protein